MRSYSARLLDRTGLSRGQRAIDLGCGPSGILDPLAERATPGGQVVGLDADPAHVTMDRQFAAELELGNEIFRTAFSRNRADPLIGRRLPELYRRAGLSDVDAECVTPPAPGGPLPPDHPARPGAQHAPGHRGARHR